jgi:transcriptional regulator with XRE-family HTH domain
MQLNQIKSDQDIDGDVALALRTRANLPQQKFWSSLGVKQSSGSFYESGKSPIPESVRKLIYTMYVAGLPLDTATPAGTAALRKLVRQSRKSAAI